MEKKSEDRITELELAFAKYKDEFRSIKSLLESINQRVEQNELHRQQTMEQMCLSMEEMTTEMVSMAHEMETLEFKKSEELNPMKVETYEWTIKDVAKTTQNDTWRFVSEKFKFTGYQYEIRAKIKNDGIIKIYLEFFHGNTFNKFVNEIGFGAVEYIWKDQSDNLDKKDIIRECSGMLFYQCFGHRNVIFRRQLSPEMMSPPYLKNDCLKVTILFQPASIDRSFVSNNGVVKWRINIYEKRTRNMPYDCGILSPTFYTSPQGYRVQLRFAMDGDETMLIYVHFLTGEHDDQLSIYFRHKTTVTLVNQLDPSKDVVTSKQRDDVNFHEIRLEKFTFAKENGFVKKGSLIFLVVIEPIKGRMVR